MPGIDTYGNDKGIPQTPPTGGSVANGPSIFDYMELNTNKSGNFPVALPAAVDGHGRSGRQQKSLANCITPDMEELEEAFKQVVTIFFVGLTILRGRGSLSKRFCCNS